MSGRESEMELFEGQIISASFLNDKAEIIKNKVKETISQIGTKITREKIG